METPRNRGAVHACAHHTQCAALIGIAAALKEPGVLDEFCGRIKRCAVSAEELLEIEFRAELKEKGVIKYFGGKSEFMHCGFFDTTDIAFMVHTSSSFRVYSGAVGCLAKTVTYKGKSSHAGGRYGSAHSADVYIEDSIVECVDSAKWQLAMLKLLLEDDAKRAYEIKKNFKAPFSSIKEYLEYSDSLNDSGDRITYNEDGMANIRL